MNNNVDVNNENHWPHRIACLLTCVVFPLIWVGNLVTTTDAGMAVPDWPNTYGYNLFLYPYREWFYGPWDLFVEHGHRLLASLAGFISIALVFVTFRGESRRWVRWFSVSILALVIFQGILGGVRVLFDERTIAKIHGCVGPLFFAACVGFAVVSSRWWKNSGRLTSNEGSDWRLWLVPKMAILMTAVSFLQLALGAFLRHIDDVAEPNQFVLLVACHIMVAGVLAFFTTIQFLNTRRTVLKSKGIRGSIDILMLLVLLQVSLGIGTWVVKFGWPSWLQDQVWAAQFIVAEKSFLQINIVTAHAAIGSLILAYWTLHMLRTCRSIRSIRKPIENNG